MRVSVIIPTFRRPDAFTRAVRSVLAQEGVVAFEIVAVDNSPEGSAVTAFKSLETRADVPFRWTHEPRPGVSHARNAALRIARGELIAWLDDDEEASPHWLASLIAVQHQTSAQSVFGPIKAQAPAGARNASFFERLYSRSGPAHSGGCDRAYGIGNSLQSRALFGDEPFAAHANESGGEDDALFAAWADAGARFAWAADAQVVEHLGAERITLAHGLKRAFAYGQGPCETAWTARRFVSLARHMTIGAAQALCYGALSAITFSASTPRALMFLDRAARGAGKVFWFWEQRFYGRALMRQPA